MSQENPSTEFNNNEFKEDRAANQNLTPLDVDILNTTNLIEQLKSDLKKEKDLERAKAIRSILDREIAKQGEQLDKKFKVAEPKQEFFVPSPEEDDAFSRAVGEADGGAINKMDKRGF